MPALFRRDRDPVAAGVRGSPGTAGPVCAVTVEQIVHRRMITADYEPVVRLDSGEVVGFRAVPRLPSGSRFSSADALWRAADEVGLGTELDQVARAAAYRGALATRMHPSVSLLVRADPRDLDIDSPPDLAEVVAPALARVRVFVTISADAVLAAPAQALAGIARARECGWGIVWTELGITGATSTMIPFVRPDVVTVDVDLLHSPHAAALLDPTRTYAEDTGASIMVTGIGSDAELHLALAAGASIGQGPYHGEPGPIPAGGTAPRYPVPILRAIDPPSPRATPYEILTADRTPLTAAAETLDDLADHLADRCRIDPERPAILITAPTVSESLHNRLSAMAGNAGMLVVFTTRPPTQPLPGVRFVTVDAGDPLARDWSVTVVGPHFCALLAARDDRPDQKPYHYSYALTHQHGIVLRAARILLARLNDRPTPAAAGGPPAQERP